MDSAKECDGTLIVAAHSLGRGITRLPLRGGAKAWPIRGGWTLRGVRDLAEFDSGEKERGDFAQFCGECSTSQTRWRSEVNSNCQYRFLNNQTTNMMSGFAAPRRSVGIARGSNAWSAYMVGNIRRRPSLVRDERHRN